jgi:hypothetical protein
MLAYRCKIRTHTPCHLPLFRSRFIIIFTLCFMPSEVHGWGTFSRCKVKLRYHLVLGPLYWECAHHEALAYITCHVIFSQTPPFIFGCVPQKNSSLWDVPNWETWFWDMPKHIRTCLHNIRHFIQLHSNRYTTI